MDIPRAIAISNSCSYYAPMDIQNMLKQILDSGLSQVQVARSLGVSQVAVSKISRGLTKTVQYDTGKAIEAMHRRVIRAKRKAAKAA